MTETIELDFDIPDALYQRAICQPMADFPARRKLILRNSIAAVLLILTLCMSALAFWGEWAIWPTVTGGLIGAGITVLATLKGRRFQVRRHRDYNATAGRQRMTIAPGGILTSRPHIESRISWPMITRISGMDGASLIDLPTARLIVPDDALPDGMSPEAFRLRLDDWRAA